MVAVGRTLILNALRRAKLVNGSAGFVIGKWCCLSAAKFATNDVMKNIWPVSATASHYCGPIRRRSRALHRLSF
jgi:hypothetical protein